MKCSLKDGFISVLLIILIAPSKGIEFPLLLQTNSVLDKPMNFQKFKAALNRLQDLDSFPDNGNSEGKLHKIVKKQMALSDSKELKKTKRSTSSVFILPTNYNRATRNGDETTRKETKKKFNGARKFDRLNGGNQHQDGKISDEILTTLKDIVKDKQYFFGNRMEKKILLQKLEEKKAKAKSHMHPSHVNSGLNECKAGIKPKSLVKEKFNLGNPIIKCFNARTKEKQNIAGIATKTKQDSVDAAVKEKPNLAKIGVKETPNTIETLVKETKITPDFATKEAQSTPNIKIKEAQNILNTGTKETQNMPNTGTKAQHIPNIPIKGAQNILNPGIKEAQKIPNVVSAAKETQSIANTDAKAVQNTPNSELELPFIPEIELLRLHNTLNIAIKDIQSIPNIALRELQNAAEQKQSSLNNPINQKKYAVNVETKDSANGAKTTGVQVAQINAFLRKKLKKFPDELDCRYYYECEEKPFGCANLRRKRCPEGQFFSYKYLTCLRAPDLTFLNEPALKVFKKSTARYLKVPALKKKGKAKRNTNSTKKSDIFDNPEDPEPSNEWMDANQGQIQKIPPEFKPKKTPGLKIYHLCSKRKMIAVLLNNGNKGFIIEKTLPKRKATKRDMADAIKSAVKRHSSRLHHPRSFVIHIKKKEGKENNDQGIIENDESEEDEENDEDDDDEDSDDEEEEAEDEVQENVEKSSRKDTLKEFFKSAKAAVTNRARFNDPSLTEPEVNQKGSNLKTKNSELNSNFKEKNKKVLLDANIKVDSTIGSALKYILKSKTKDKENHSSSAGDERLISDRGSQDQLDPELIRMYEHLIRNNPRVKRHFLANCSKKGN